MWEYMPLFDMGARKMTHTRNVRTAQGEPWNGR